MLGAIAGDIIGSVHEGALPLSPFPAHPDSPYPIPPPSGKLAHASSMCSVLFRRKSSRMMKMAPR